MIPDGCTMTYRLRWSALKWISLIHTRYNIYASSVYTLEQFLVHCRGWCRIALVLLSLSRDWSWEFVVSSRTIIFNAKTIRNPVTRVFPRFSLLACFFVEFWLASWDIFSLDWLLRLLWFCNTQSKSVLRRSARIMLLQKDVNQLSRACS